MLTPLTKTDFKPRTKQQAMRRMTLLALRAADKVGTSDVIELRETVKDLCARDMPPVPYDGPSIDSALRRALGIRGQVFRL